MSEAATNAFLKGDQLVAPTATFALDRVKEEFICAKDKQKKRTAKIGLQYTARILNFRAI